MQLILYCMILNPLNINNAIENHQNLIYSLLTQGYKPKEVYTATTTNPPVEYALGFGGLCTLSFVLSLIKAFLLHAINLSYQGFNILNQHFPAEGSCQCYYRGAGHP